MNPFTHACLDRHLVAAYLSWKTIWAKGAWAVQKQHQGSGWVSSKQTAQHTCQTSFCHIGAPEANLLEGFSYKSPSCPHFTKKKWFACCILFPLFGVQEWRKANTITTNFDLLCPMGSLCPRMAVAGSVGSWVAIWTGLMQWVVEIFTTFVHIHWKPG